MNAKTKALVANSAAWSKVNKRLKRYRIQRYLLRIVLILAMVTWLVLNFTYDKTDIVPQVVYFLLVGLAATALIVDVVMYIFLVLPGEREMDDLNRSSA